MKKSIVLILMLFFVIINLDSKEYPNVKRKTDPTTGRDGSYIEGNYLPSKYWQLKIKHLVIYEGEGGGPGGKTVEIARRDYKEGFIPCFEMLENYFNQKLRDKFNERTAEEEEIKYEISFLRFIQDRLMEFYLDKKSYNYPIGKVYGKKLEKLMNINEKRELEATLYYDYNYSRKVAKELCKVNIYYPKTLGEQIKTIEIFKKGVYSLVLLKGYIKVLIKKKKYKEMDTFYKKYKNKITDKEWMRSPVFVKWIKNNLKKGYDALHKQDSSYPTGDEMAKEVDDKIASLKAKGMKFWSKYK